ncbi:MAG: lysophospholipid acyltransferase family protein [Bacteroidales bacterium]
MSAGVKITEMLMRLLALQPLKMHYFWGRCLSWFVSGPMHYRRDVVMINLARSFPEKKYSELRKIADDFYKHFGDLFAETFWFAGSHDTKRLRDSHICEMEHADVLNRLYNDCPGVIVLTSHLGNWELTGGILNYVYAPDKVDFGEKNTTVVYKELSNSFWDKVFGDNRCAPIAKENKETCYVESRKILRFVIAHRNEKRLYIFPTDQCPYKYASAHTVDNFMHQPTLTMTGGAALAHKFGFAVVYMAFKKKEDFGYKMSFREICPDASKFTPEDIMNKFYSYLEEDVNAQPENYLWTHKRWKK